VGDAAVGSTSKSTFEARTREIVLAVHPSRGLVHPEGRHIQREGTSRGQVHPEERPIQRAGEEIENC
jgi:hypothetical protein